VSEVLIVGASVRAAMQSARRAGLVPTGIDLFGDRDSRAIGEMHTIPLSAYPQGFVPIAETLPRRPWFYTGGLENTPEVVDQIAQHHSLMGNHSGQLLRVRGPALRSLCINSNIPHPETRETCPADPSGWLEKSWFSSGGLGVRWAASTHSKCEYQRYSPGRLISAVVHTRRILGFTEQLPCREFLHAPDFCYPGSLGPIAVPAEVRWQFETMLSRITNEAALQHLWGFDTVLTDNGGVLLLEVNPRYPASVETIELGDGIAALQPSEPSHSRSILKAIYYAPFDLHIPEYPGFDESVRLATDPWAVPGFADVPHVGSICERGDPVVTILEAITAGEPYLDVLKRRVDALDELFAGCRI
jgi:uncharacterized protein